MSREPFSSETKRSFLPSGGTAGWYSSLVPLVSCRSPEPSVDTIQMLRAETRLAAGLLLLLGEPPAVVFRRPFNVPFVHDVVALEDGRGSHARHLHDRVVRLSSPPEIPHRAPTEVMEEETWKPGRLACL